MYPIINGISDHDAQIITLTQTFLSTFQDNHFLELEKLTAIQSKILYTF